MQEKKKGQNFGILTSKSARGHTPRFFIFVDTETIPITLNETTTQQVLKLGHAIFWDRKENREERLDFYTINEFWDWVVTRKGKENRSTRTTLYIFAHNMDFDFKILQGYQELSKRDYEVISQYSKGRTLLLDFRNGTRNIKIRDTLNYVQRSLKDIGTAIGYPKLDVDPVKEQDEQKLLKYCQRDTEIIFRFIQRYIEFLEINDLGGMKNTIGSNALNACLLHLKPGQCIMPHTRKKAIELERDSYRGGISMSFTTKHRKKMTMLDVNSMYPSIMKTHGFPIRLIAHLRPPKHSFYDMSLILKEALQARLGVIAHVNITVPREYPIFARTTHQGHNALGYGTFNITLAEPELKYVQKHGKINGVMELTIYEKDDIFSGYIDKLFSLKQKYEKENNPTFRMITKLFMNSTYGKFGQKKNEFVKIGERDDSNFLTHKIIDSENETTHTYIQIDKNLYEEINTNENTAKAFVAIASYVTSYARVKLLNYIIKAKWGNVVYCDTDSVVVSKEGLQRLQKDITPNLGDLAIQGEPFKPFFAIAPKVYQLGEKLRIKGVPKRAIPKEFVLTNKPTTFKTEHFTKFRESFNKGSILQLIEQRQKTIQPVYNHGYLIKASGRIEPFIFKSKPF